jgi:hypothetical protein
MYHIERRAAESVILGGVCQQLPGLPADHSPHRRGRRGHLHDEHGQVSMDALRGILYNRVKLIAITHIPTSGGLVN